MVQFILICTTITLVYAGSLTPAIVPINNTIANRGEYADYTFAFIPDTTVPVGGQLHIRFPMQFAAGLGIDRATSTTCSLPCFIEKNLVVFYFYSQKILANIEQSVRIFRVLNPPNSGGTGSFILHTQRHETIFDENRIFYVMGIADSVGILSQALVSADETAGTYMAGSLSKYNFVFKTNQDLPKETMIQLGIPLESGFSISDQPSCSLFPINGVEILGSLSCLRNNGYINVRGLKDKISAGSQVGIIVALTNPSQSIITQSFSIAAFRDQTSVMYSQINGIMGVQITPGQINQVTLTSLSGINALGKVTDYNLIFLPSNALPDGAAIIITFPQTFPLVIGTPYEFVNVIEGLDDISELRPLQLEYSLSSISISSFKAITKPIPIIIRFRATNPSQQGPSSSLIIRTYTDTTLSTIIDENILDAMTTIQNIPSLAPTSILATQPMSQGQSTDLIFTVTPGVFVPPGSVVRMLLDGFRVGVAGASNCISKVGTINSESVKCEISDSLVSMTNPMDVQYNVGTPSRFKLRNFVVTPLYAQTYMINIEMVTAAGIILFTYTDYLQIIPYELHSPQTFLIGQERSTLLIPKFSILHLQFTTETLVPQGAFTHKTTDLQGRVEIQFGTGEWAVDLGTGIANGAYIPCKAIVGLLEMAGRTVKCILYHSPPRVTIEGFQAVIAGTNVIVHIPGIQNTMSTAMTTKLQIELVQYENRIRTVLNDANSFTLELVDQESASTSTTTKNIQVTGFELGGFFEIQFEPGLGFNINQESYFLVKLPGYDTKFLPPEDTVLCYIDGIITPCYTYPGLDWILLRTEKGQKYYYSLIPIIRLKNLKWPRYVNQVGYLQWTLINGEAGHHKVELESKIIYSTGLNGLFPAPLPNNFITSRILSPIKGTGYVGIQLEFYFVANDLIPEGGSVRLTFPTEFNLKSSYPQTSFETPQFRPSGSSIIFTINQNVIMIDGIAEHPSRTPFTIVAHGVRTSSSPPYLRAQGWSIQTSYQGYIVNEKNNFDQFEYGNSFVPEFVIFQGVVAFPSNQRETAVYSITFILLSQLQEGSEIIIEFPSQYYPILPIPPYDCKCSVSGGINSFYSCILQGSQYIITLDEPYNSGDITFSVDNIINPLAGTTEGFIITTRYDGSFIDKTDELFLYLRNVEITDSAHSLIVQSVEFNPRNEGEVSTYSLALIPSSGIQLGMQLMVQFPNQYDKMLGVKIICTASTVAVPCTVSERRVWISGITGYVVSANAPLIVVISGIINPNIFQNDDKVGQIGVATLYQNTYHFIDYIIGVGYLDPTASPGWAQLYNVIPSNTFSRWKNTNYMFNFTSIIGVPSAASYGSVIVDFPQQFSIPNGEVPCFPFAGSDGSVFADNLLCQVTDNSIWVQGNSQTRVGAILFNVTQVLNPQDEVKSGNMIMKVYDGFSQQIVEKSYSNLDPWTFTYEFPGPLIQVNSDLPIILEAGTFSNELYFTLDHPCTLDLNFTPITSFTVSPLVVKMHIGDLSQSFRLSAPEYTQAGTYYIVWLTEGEMDIPQYTPIKKSMVQVTRTGKIRILVPDLWEIPLGGTSTDQLITIDFAPDLGFEMIFRPLSLTVTMMTKTVTIAGGQNQAMFRVVSNKTEYDRQKALLLDRTDVREIKIDLQGLNKNIYRLSQDTLKINFVSADNQSPFITDILVSKISQTNVSVVFGTAEICVVYFVLALQGTAKPSMTEMINAGPAPVPTSLSRYFKVLGGKENIASSFINGLSAQTPYVIYAVAEDRGGLFSEIKIALFITLNRYNASLSTLEFMQSYINQAERINILSKLAFFLSLNPKKVIEVETTQLRILQTSGIINFYIISNPSIDSINPSMLVQYLNNRRHELKLLLPNLNETAEIKAVEFVPYVPRFVEPPTNINSTFSTCTIKGRLDSMGYIFMIITEALTDIQVPKSVQVWWGYNGMNVPHPAGFIKVDKMFTFYNKTIGNLQVNTDYNIYVVAGSDHPGYPDLPPDQEVYKIPCRTQNYIKKQHLNILYGIIKSLQVLLILYLI